MLIILLNRIQNAMFKIESYFKLFGLIRKRLIEQYNTVYYDGVQVYRIAALTLGFMIGSIFFFFSTP